MQTHAQETLKEPARLRNLLILGAGLSQEPQVRLEVLSNLTNKTLERKLADEQFRGLLGNLYILGVGLSRGCWGYNERPEHCEFHADSHAPDARAPPSKPMTGKFKWQFARRCSWLARETCTSPHMCVQTSFYLARAPLHLDPH